MRANVIAIDSCDRCNCHMLILIFVADDIVTYDVGVVIGQMLCHVV